MISRMAHTGTKGLMKNILLTSALAMVTIFSSSCSPKPKPTYTVRIIATSTIAPGTPAASLGIDLLTTADEDAGADALLSHSQIALTAASTLATGVQAAKFTGVEAGHYGVRGKLVDSQESALAESVIAIDVSGDATFMIAIPATH